MRVVDAIYHFLASLKLAVISISTLAAVLAYATFFESWYGTAASQEYIYRSAGFAILLAFLGINILCAALIRFPWKKRQTGFVVTHLGLLVLLGGSYWSLRTADEGQVGMTEGESRGELVRTDYPVIRLWELDPHTRERKREYDLPFRPGSFEWGPGKPKPRSFFENVFSILTLGFFSPDNTREVLSQPNDPFKFVVKSHLPASAPAEAHVADPSGDPMAKIDVQFKGPGMPKAMSAFPDDHDSWFELEKRFHRVVKDPEEMPAIIAFSSVDRAELVEDFLKPPMGGPDGVARFRYTDKAGKIRVHDWAIERPKEPLEGQSAPPGEKAPEEKTEKSITLPDSDLTVTLRSVSEFPTRGEPLLARAAGRSGMLVALFKIKKGDGEPIDHYAMASLPMVPNVIPSASDGDAGPKAPLASINYIVPPVLDPKVNGKFGQIEVLAGPDGKLHYRVFGRGKEKVSELRGAGSLAKGELIPAFGGQPNMPMTINFRLEEYLPSAIGKEICEPVVLPKGQMGEGIPASLVEMTVGDVTKEFWIRRSGSLDPPRPQAEVFGGSIYEIAYDVDRKPLGFDIKLDDFEVGFEPGTESATKFVSKVRLNDPSEGIKDKPYTISMNEPMDHRGFTFYQMRYIAMQDPRTGQRTGQFQSVFQVGIDPGRTIKYLGSLLIVLGTFLQFYMRAGLFTDGGKREREKAQAKALKAAGNDAALPPVPEPQPAPPAIEEPL